MKLTIKDRGGFLGLYRGIGPGTIRSFLANGTSMIVMVHAQKKVTAMGWRDSPESKLEEEDWLITIYVIYLIEYIKAGKQAAEMG